MRTLRGYLKISTRSILSALIVPLFVAAVLFAQEYFPNIIVKGAPWYDIRGYTSITTALAGIGASEKTLLLFGNVPVASDTIIPATTHVWYLNSGKFTVAAGKVLTHTGSITAGNHLIWVGPGTIVPPKQPLNLAWIGSLTNTVALLGANVCEINVDGQYVQAADVNTPATMAFRFHQPGYVSVSTGFTWTIAGNIYGSPGCFPGVGAVVPSNLQVNDSSWWSSFRKAVTDIGANVRSIGVSSAQVISLDTTVPATLSTVIQGSGQLQPAGGITLTINGPFSASAHQVFGGAGTIVLGSGIIAYPDYWTNNDVPGTTEMGAAITSAITASGTIAFQPGMQYAYATSPTFAKTGLVIHGNNAIMKHTGAGNAFVLDAGAPPAGVQGMHISDLVVQGNANSTNGVYVNRVHRSTFDNLRVAGCAVTGSGLLIDFAICNTWTNFTCSDGGYTLNPVPLNGITLTEEDATHYPTTQVFINPILEGLTGTGINVDYAVNCTFINGTSESNNKGIVISSDSSKHKFLGVGVEDNTTSDIECTGNNNYFSMNYKIAHFYSPAARNTLDTCVNTLAGGSTTIDAGANYNQIRNCQITTLTDNSGYTSQLGVTNKLLSASYDGIQTFGGLSGTATPARNTAGSATATGAAATAVWTLGHAEDDANYKVSYSVASVTGAPAVGAYTVLSVTKAVGSVTLNLSAAPGGATAITYDVHLMR